MKKLLTLFYLGASLISCAQKEVKKEDIMNQENIQKVANIYKEVKTYDYNPQYTLHIEKAANFSYELLINDFPVQINYDPGIVTGSITINKSILKKGKQKLTVRMTPPVGEEYNIGKEIDLSISELKLSINYGDYDQQKVKEFKEILNYEMPQKNEKLPYYEINLEFDAPIVPYENDIKGWQNSVDLSKEDKEQLQKEVEGFYKQMIALYKSKDVNGLAGKYYNSQKEIAQSHYLNKPYDSQIVVDEWIKDVNDLRPFIFFGYMMKLYGDGKLVRLVKKDKYYFDYSALMREDPKTEKAVEYKMYLHRPKPGAPLEVIR